MSFPFKPIDLEGLKTYPLSTRRSKVREADFASPWEKGESFTRFLEGLPNILAGAHIRDVIASVANAHRNQKTVLMGMGAHVIKVGLNPVVIDLMARNILTGVAMNGAGIIHDLEVAMVGQTSEDVAESLGDGSFGMARETGEFLNKAISDAEDRSSGLGEAVGSCIIDHDFPYADRSILAAGVRFGIPVTVHVAMGTDIIHMHPGFDPRAAGGATHRDFRTFASMVASLESGVYLNVGSAVILPEVFLKSVTLARNLGFHPEKFTTVNLDFIQHYRPMTNVVRRPTQEGGQGFSLTGHHEILLPIIASGVIEETG